jgi:hypothetical protein
VQEAGVREAHFPRLRLHGGSDLGNSVADADHVYAGASVKPLLAFLIVEVHALTVRNAQPAVIEGAVK